MPNNPIHVISLGAGVQSSTMALMAALGEIVPMPTAAVFADTQAEPKAVYIWLDWLETQLPFPVYRVTAGNLMSAIAQKRGDFRRVDIPAFVQINGRRGGLINRSCTRDYKLRPLKKQYRALVGLTGKRAPKEIKVISWIGISTDEASRMKPSREAWIDNRWPLIELRMNRSDCLRWMEAHGYPEPPKSSCLFCPFHSDHQWLLLTLEERRAAIRVDELLRSHPATEYRQDGTLFLHRSLKPMREVFDDFDFLRDFQEQPNMFINECEGVCGL